MCVPSNLGVLDSLNGPSSAVRRAGELQNVKRVRTVEVRGIGYGQWSDVSCGRLGACLIRRHQEWLRLYQKTEGEEAL